MLNPFNRSTPGDRKVHNMEKETVSTRGRKKGSKYISASDAFLGVLNKTLEDWLRDPNNHIGYDTISKVEALCSASKIAVPKYLAELKGNKIAPAKKKDTPVIGSVITREVFINRGKDQMISMVPVPNDIYKISAGRSVNIKYEKDKIVITF